jgi:aconitate hydratase
MDARSIAATATAGGAVTAAGEFCATKYAYNFDDSSYKAKVYDGFGKPNADEPLVFGPNITDWPEFHPLKENVLLEAVSIITDPVTTTDELIPSGETSSYRSNPVRLSEFTLSRKDPAYVGKAKTVRDNTSRFDSIMKNLGVTAENVSAGSFICAIKPGDGSAREQAASCQKVLGGLANIAKEYATKRYRSNLINWGILPFTYSGNEKIEVGTVIFVPNVKNALKEGKETVKAYIVGEEKTEIELSLGKLTESEREILIKGCLINYYKYC